MPDRGVCRVCGRDWPLVYTSGYIKQHRDANRVVCPGSGKPPAKPGDTQLGEGRDEGPNR